MQTLNKIKTLLHLKTRNKPLTVKLGFLQYLDLADMDLMKWVNTLAVLLNLFADTVWDPDHRQINNVHENWKQLFSVKLADRY